MGGAKQLTFDELERMEINEKMDKAIVKRVKGPYELPEGWKWTKLKDIVTEDRDQISPQDFPDQEFWLVTMDCVEPNTGKLLQRVVVRGKEIKSVKFRFNSKHILYGKLRPYLNKVYAPDGEGICTTEFIPLLPDHGIYRDFLAIYLRTQYVVNYAMKNLTGARQPRVDLNAFFKLPVPIPFKNNKPDLEEQKRIVAKIQELFSKIDRIKELRRQAREEAENLLKAALHHVFSRADERGWKWVRLRDVVEVWDNYRIPVKKEDRKKGPYPYCGANGIIDHVNGYTHEGEFLLVAEDGGFFGPGESTAYIMNGKFWANNHVHVLKVTNGMNIRFLMYYLNLADLTPYLTGATRPKLSQKPMLRIPVPKPDLEEQKRIAAYLDKIAEKQRKLLELYEQTEKELELVKQAILSKAFRGEL
ncbi:MAG: restriction endonuclease subunit S [Archaeoglobus sp.]|uniref:restriction endonuclease subunit S n=1 Tax=Archaeoglobus sp. TaxID=1872626 RepID=UPI001DA3BAF8|nr:restriction endonuclease subunit S [Archaeoglobus sp.]MBO8179736.1 restriction endonuclease subunit S [Archaeoglobus sp.]